MIDPKRYMADASPEVLRRNLRLACQELSARGLHQAAKWALELLVCVPAPPVTQGRGAGNMQATPARTTANQAGTSKLHPAHSTPALSFSRAMRAGVAVAGSPGEESMDHDSGRFTAARLPPSPLANLSYDTSHVHNAGGGDVGGEGSDQGGSTHVRFAPSADASSIWSGAMDSAYIVDQEEDDVYALAKSLFDAGQLQRCVSLLSRHNASSAKSTFLRLHARLEIAERELDEDAAILSKSRGKLPITSEALLSILSEVIDPKDPFLLYIKGVVLRKLKKRIEAMDCFVRSICIFPYNWTAWLELASVLDHECEELEDLLPVLPDSFMTCFFIEHYGRDLQRMRDTSLALCDHLLEIFPDCPQILVCQALNLYFSKDNDAALAAFERAREIDPLLLEGIAEYSNILHITDQADKLAHLTHSLAEAGRDSADMCCAVGNYHSLMGDHVRAAESFKRALRLNLRCLPAWILLGHSFIELKNAHAAAEMYRRAIDLNPRDVRPWTGLGTVYELYEAWSYALYYFRKACASDPYDPRFWESIANCHQKLHQYDRAIACYQRQLAIGLGIGDQLKAMENIIAIHDHRGDEARAAVWHRRIVHLLERQRSLRMVSAARAQAAMEQGEEPTGAAAHAGAGPSASGQQPQAVAGLATGIEASVDSWGADGATVARYVLSYIQAARWEMGEIRASEEEGEAQFAPAGGRGRDRVRRRRGRTDGQHGEDMDVDRNGTRRGHSGRDEAVPSDFVGDGEEEEEEDGTGGVVSDLRGQSGVLPARGPSPTPGNAAIAYEYLQRVVAAGTERSAEAEELLKRLGGAPRS